MNEHGFNAKLARLLRGAGVSVWKVHDPYAGGVPDFRLRGTQGRYAYLESKYLKEWPKRDTTLILPALSVQQRTWLNDEHLNNMTCGIIIGIDKSVLTSFDPVDWNEGFSVASGRQRCRSVPDTVLYLRHLLTGS